MTTKLDKGDEDVGGVVRAVVQRVLADPDGSAIKLVAWTYGNSRSGSDEEQQLLALLRQKLTS